MKVWVQWNYGFTVDIEPDDLASTLDVEITDAEIQEIVMDDVYAQARENMPTPDVRIDEVVEKIRELLDERKVKSDE